MCDVLIIGRGPAGVSAAIYAARANCSVTIIAHDDGALSRADKINNYYGFPSPIGGKELLTRGIEQAKSLGVEFIDEEVLSIGYDKNFTITTASQTLTAKCIVLATGAPRKTPNIKNIELFAGAGVSYCAICDAFFFRGADVVILGSGQYALNELNELLPVVKSVKILTNGEKTSVFFPEDVEVIDKKISSLEGDGVLQKVVFEDGSDLETSGLFVALGIAGGNELAKKLGVLTVNNSVVVNENKETNVPGVFAIGDCTEGLRQVARAVSDGAIAGVKIAEFIRKNK